MFPCPSVHQHPNPLFSYLFYCICPSIFFFSHPLLLPGNSATNPLFTILFPTPVQTISYCAGNFFLRAELLIYTHELLWVLCCHVAIALLSGSQVVRPSVARCPLWLDGPLHGTPRSTERILRAWVHRGRRFKFKGDARGTRWWHGGRRRSSSAQKEETGSTSSLQTSPAHAADSRATFATDAEQLIRAPVASVHKRTQPIHG